PQTAPQFTGPSSSSTTLRNLYIEEREEVDHGIEWRGGGSSADLVDASGRTLPAGIPRAAGQGRVVLDHVHGSGDSDGDHAPADPPLRFRCRDYLLRYSHRSLCARPHDHFHGW